MQPRDLRLAMGTDADLLVNVLPSVLSRRSTRPPAPVRLRDYRV